MTVLHFPDLDTRGGPDEAEEITYWEMVNETAGQRITDGLCLHSRCHLDRAATGALTCGGERCKQWLASMPDTLRAYLYETLAASVTVVPAAAIPEREAGDWRTLMVAGMVGGVTSGALVIGAFVVGVWQRWLHITA